MMAGGCLMGPAMTPIRVSTTMSGRLTALLEPAFLCGVICSRNSVALTSATLLHFMKNSTLHLLGSSEGTRLSINLLPRLLTSGASRMEQKRETRSRGKTATYSSQNGNAVCRLILLETKIFLLHVSQRSRGESF